jgi:hypothetical protein
MSHSQPLHITTVYDAGGFAGADAGRRVLGIVALIVAAGWIYGTWWHADTWIQKKLLFAVVSKPSPVMLDFGALLGVIPPEERAAHEEVARVEASEESRSELLEFTAVSSAWQAIMTASGCLLLAFGSASLCSGIIPRKIIRSLFLLSMMIIVGAGGLAYYLNSLVRLGTREERMCVVILIVGAFLLGLSLSRRATVIQWVAGIGAVAAACASIVALWSAGRDQMIDPQWTTISRMTLVFLIVSAFGFFLIIQRLLTR